MGHKDRVHSVPHQAGLRTFVSTAQKEAVQEKIDKMALLGAIHPVFSNTEGGEEGGRLSAVSSQQYITGRRERQRLRLCYKPNESKLLC